MTENAAAASAFLRDRPPFDTLTAEELDGLLGRSAVDEYSSGAVIFDGFAESADAMFVVLGGNVDLWNSPDHSGDPDEHLGTGDVFGYSSLLTGTRSGPLAVASGPARICQVPGDAGRRLFSGIGGAAFLATKLTVPHRRDGSAPAAGTVDALIRSDPVVGSPDMTVQQAAALMTERHQDYVVVPRPDGSGYGVLSDGDIRSRVVAAGRSTSIAVGDVIDRPAFTVGHGTPAADALAVILEHDLESLPVVDSGGRIVGVVAPADFIAAPAGTSMFLRSQISHSATVEDLQTRAVRIPYLVGDLLRRGQPAHEITAVASLVNDAVVRRALELVLDGHPELDPAALTWLSLGSNARREPVLSSDIDSAVSFDDSVTAEQIVAYRAAFAEVDEVLRGAGMTIDANGAIASMPLFARTHAQWRAAAEVWLAQPLENKGIIFTSLLLDERPIWGDRGLSAVAEVFGDLRSHPRTMSLLLSESLSKKARLRSMRDVLAGRGGTFDIKNHALSPLVNIARWAALSVESGALDTRSRLSSAAGSRMMPAEHASTLIDVFDVLQRIRLTYQVAQFDRGEPATDVLTMKRLSPLDRSLLAQAVREVGGIQRRMVNMSHYAPVADLTDGQR